MSPDLAKELAQRNAVPFNFIKGPVFSPTRHQPTDLQLPNAPILEGEYCVVLPSRDFFDESLATAVLTFVSNQASTVSIRNTLVLLDSFVCPQYTFDAVAVLSLHAAKQFEHENDCRISERSWHFLSIVANCRATRPLSLVDLILPRLPSFPGLEAIMPESDDGVSKQEEQGRFTD